MFGCQYHRLGVWGQQARRKLHQILHTQPECFLSTIQQCEYYVNLDSEIIKATGIQKSAKCWYAVIGNLTAPARGVILVS